MKHKLILDELQVDSFATDVDAPAKRGTVRGQEATTRPTCDGGASCGVSCVIEYTCATCQTCAFSCNGSCITCLENTCP